jgi:hypothetical protein
MRGDQYFLPFLARQTLILIHALQLAASFKELRGTGINNGPLPRFVYPPIFCAIWAEFGRPGWNGKDCPAYK